MTHVGTCENAEYLVFAPSVTELERARRVSLDLFSSHPLQNCVEVTKRILMLVASPCL